jgi:DNA polymerase-3 subunit gamma/tau
MESLANKYRPFTFDDVVGQENTITILKNQIQQDTIKKGYLFNGGAGTGKTTIARIFAREINGEKGEIIEIDAASNNGVDHVRELRENCKFKPINGGYKVYVIDECHMLSTGAWNALLKTLEEPPAHCVFILCTTDPQKIPATILSRVQRFNFKRMTLDQLIERLEHIVVEEDLLVDKQAVEYIAKLANGGMRDAISILDTCSSYGEEIFLEDVQRIVGSGEHDRYVKLANFILDRDHEMVIKAIETIHQEGKDLRQFIKGFIEFVLEVEKNQIIGPEYCSYPSSLQDDIDDLGKDKIYEKWFEKLIKMSDFIKYEQNPKVLIEGLLISL